jgi:hypothetical protein
VQRFGPYHPGHQPPAAAGSFGSVLSAPYGRNAGIGFPLAPQVGASIYPTLSRSFFQTRYGVVKTISPSQRTATQIIRGGNG